MARLFDGVDDVINTANETNFDFAQTQPFSCFTWFYWTSATTFGVLFGKLQTNAPNQGWDWHVDNSGYLAFQLNGTTATLYLDTLPTTIPINRWVALGTTYNGNALASGVTFYFDGVTQTKGNISDLYSGTMLNDFVLRIGARQTSGAPAQFLTGWMAEAAIWNVELTSGDIFRLSRGVPPGIIQRANLKGYWKLLGESPETDYSGNGSTGTVVGTTQVPAPPKTMVVMAG
jgi:concanavalin A-like lectin/glucanase superfamily protein